MEVVTSIIISNKHSYSITLDLTKENVSAYFNYKKPKREQYYLTHPYNTLEVSTPSRQSIYFDSDFCISCMGHFRYSKTKSLLRICKYDVSTEHRWFYIRRWFY